jgi:phosphoenolpyruvate carboxylase
MSDKNEDCNCDQALALIEIVNRLVKERDEARREVDAMRNRMDRIVALCEKADEAEWDSAILHFADIFNIAEEAADATSAASIERGG